MPEPTPSTAAGADGPAPPAPPAPRRGPARGGVLPAERALAPDLARGLMLLLIVLSNTVFYLWTAEHGPSGWHPTDGALVDRVVQFAMIVGLDLRVFPLFAFLFGYGMAQVVRRQVAAGGTERGAVRILRRRSLWLLLFGMLHGALLMSGDILGTYAVSSLIIGWLFLRRRDTTLLVWAGVFFVLLVVTEALNSVTMLEAGDAAALATTPSTEYYASGESDYPTSVAMRFFTWLFISFGGGLMGFAFHAAMLLGIWAARRRVLEEPGRHLGLLRTVAVAGLATAWLGGLPSALAHVGLIEASPAMMVELGPLYTLQSATGLFGGLGYVALFALAAHALSARTRRSLPVVAVAAVGKRSLSTYLTHSLLFSPALAAWGLGLGAHLHSASVAAFAVGVWLVTVAGAYALERAGRRGPAEVLLRRLMYGRAERRSPAGATGGVGGAAAPQDPGEAERQGG
ncbi:DUF418 domain-containing protein [Streptomonospora sp. S1-112]|uniref:DUF418 domain-containing protein n=1 Tax=Streptomonospora mangrovi TaxID=2883123 RepID=A0A9X3NYY4_9ACTN|nr:DUF418 domain-containing protein [Streptomonospora mangrovi]MDA0566976.1 DUF418 domain-containing protein [Streptomonospora mangrovi]